MTARSTEWPTIRISFGAASEPAGSFAYRVSQVQVYADREIEELVPFALPAAQPRGGGGRRSPASASLPMIYDGRGWIGGREVRIVARAAGVQHRLEVDDGTVLSVSAHGDSCFLSVVSSAADEAARLTVLGPGLALALALLGRFSLHAGAVEIEGRTHVIMGESGSGKSTLSACASGRPGARRVADDVVPVTVSQGGAITLLPRFPQLKLAQAEQWQGEPELACSCVLSMKRDPSIVESDFAELSNRDGVLRLLESTVASRVFSPELRERQLDAWVLSAKPQRVLEWRVPEAPGRLAEIFESLVGLRPRPRPGRLLR